MTTMADRCDCPYPDPMTYGGPNPLCPEHGDVDAILASGRYVDRLGAVWSYVGLAGLWVLWDHPGNGRLTPGQMRLKIERDLHRDECPGLRDCDDHPVPHVVIWSEGPAAHDTRTDTEVHRDTLTEALDAARNTAGETP